MFRLDDSEKVVELVCAAEDLTPKLTPELVTAQFRQSPYAAFRLNHKQLEQALEAMYADDAYAATETIAMPIAERVDALVDVVIDEGQMSARIIVIGAHGGETPTVEQLVTLLKEHGVNFGLSGKAIKHVAERAVFLPPDERLEQPIAKGKPAKAGRNGYIEQLAKTAQDRMLQPKEREDGSVDMRDLGSVITVSKGEQLMRRHPPTSGEAGTDVCGNNLEPQPGQDISLYIGEGTVASPNDPDLLLADRDGVPVLLENGMKVDDVLVMPTVDVSTGHVRFKGSVLIEGDVHEGMEVSSEGDIIITGSVESARLFAAGDVTVAQGIIGHKTPDNPDADAPQKMSAHVEAQGSIHAAFAQYAELNAKQVSVEKQLVHCKVNSQGGLFIGRDNQPGGRLIGGDIQINEQLQVGEIGTDAGARTHITLAKDHARMREEMTHLVNEIKSLKEQAQETVDSIKELHQAGGWEDMIKQETSRYKEMAKQIKLAKTNLMRLKAQTEHLLVNSRIEVHHTLHSHLYVQMAGKRIVSERDHGPSVVKWHERELVIEPLTK